VAPGDYSFVVRVTDNGVPPLSATTSFKVTLLPGTFITGARIMNGQLTFSFSSILGRNYRVEWSDSLLPGSWQPLVATQPGTGQMITISDPVTATGTRFYRIALLD
jgi:hypothetical protein